MKQTLSKLALLALWAMGFCADTASAQTLALWDYEPQMGALTAPTSNSGTVGGTSSYVLGTGAALTAGTRTGMTGTGCGAQNGVTAWAFEPFNPGSANEATGAQFNVSTTGYQNIAVSWDQRWSNTCPNTVRLQYTLNGSTWTNFVMTNANTTYCLGTINVNGCFEVNTTGDIFTRLSSDLSGIAGANNNPNFAVRMVVAYYQSTTEFRQTSAPTLLAGTAGTWRFDNVAITGTLLPGPSASTIVNSGPASYCSGSGPTNIAVNITGGTGPFTLVYSDGTTNTTVNNYVSGTAISVNPASTKTYTIVSVTNANGVTGTGNSGAATVTVNALPAVPSSANVTTCATGAVALAGSPAGGTWSIPNPYSGPSTTFTYTVTNANGCSRTSSTYTFTRRTAPTWVVQPTTVAQTVCQGSAFPTMTVVASGTGPITYQWFRNTIASTTGGTSLSGGAFAAEVAAGSQTATFTPLSTTVGTYYYYVQATNVCTTVKSTVTPVAFTVVTPTVAGTVSSNQTVCAGDLAAPLVLSGQTGTVVKWQKALDAAFTVGVTDILTASTTLAGASIGAINQTTYVRAFVKNSVCNTDTTVPVELLIKSTTWTGTWSNGVPDSATTAIFAANYSSSGNLSACSAQVTSGAVVFNPGDVLTLQKGLTVSGGSLTFENTASLIQVTNAANSGNITYKRDAMPMRRYDYTYWSSPVNAQILASFSPQTLSDKYFWWNTSTYNWATIAAPGITPMDIGKGYIIRAPQPFDPVVTSVFHGAFTGVPNNGNYTVSIVMNSPTQTLNLIGNPYPSAISADAFMSDPANVAALGTGTTLYFWTHNTPITSYNYSGSDYASYNYTGGTGTAPAPGLNNATPNGIIGAGQAFMIKAIATGTALFKNSMRTGVSNTQFFRPSGHSAAVSDKNRLWLDLTNDAGLFKQMLIGYVWGATDAYETGYDADVLEGGNPISFYSLTDAHQLSIQGRSLPFEASQTLALGYRVTNAGNYQIALSNWDGLFATQAIYLEDRTLNIVHDLKQGAYAFSAETGSNDTRFVLRFTDATLGVAQTNVKSNALVVYRSGQTVFVDAGTRVIESIELFDMSGRSIGFRNTNATQAQLPVSAATQVAMLRVTMADGTVIYRKIAI